MCRGNALHRQQEQLETYNGGSRRLLHAKTLSLSLQSISATVWIASLRTAMTAGVLAMAPLSGTGGN